MKLPRDISGRDLAARLVRFGYSTTRQTGSHIRLSNVAIKPTHHITIPAHPSLRIGTLSAVLKEIALANGKTIDEVRALIGL